jgi:hypothetical protein
MGATVSKKDAVPPSVARRGSSQSIARRGSSRVSALKSQAAFDPRSPSLPRTPNADKGSKVSKLQLDFDPRSPSVPRTPDAEAGASKQGKMTRASKLALQPNGANNSLNDPTGQTNKTLQFVPNAASKLRAAENFDPRSPNAVRTPVKDKQTQKVMNMETFVDPRSPGARTPVRC